MEKDARETKGLCNGWSGGKKPGEAKWGPSEEKPLVHTALVNKWEDPGGKCFEPAVLVLFGSRPPEEHYAVHLKQAILHSGGKAFSGGAKPKEGWWRLGHLPFTRLLHP